MNKEACISYVTHDEDDGMWQFLCEKKHSTSDAKIISLQAVFELDSSVGLLCAMPCGYYATRNHIADAWIIQKKDEASI